MKTAHLIPSKETYTMQEACDFLGVSHSTVRRKCPGFEKRVTKIQLKVLFSDIHPMWSLIFVDSMSFFISFIRDANATANKNGYYHEFKPEQ